MKVKLFANICGPEGSFNIGDEPNLSEKLANALIKDGYAKEIEETSNINEYSKEKTQEIIDHENINKIENDIHKDLKPKKRR